MQIVSNNCHGSALCGMVLPDLLCRFAMEKNIRSTFHNVQMRLSSAMTLPFCNARFLVIQSRRRSRLHCIVPYSATNNRCGNPAVCRVKEDNGLEKDEYSW